MADGFKKYFNGTTINGRANVRVILLNAHKIK